MISGSQERFVSIRRLVFTVAFLLIQSYSLFSQYAHEPLNSVILSGSETPAELARIAARVTPSQRQLAWQELEFTAFIHFSINTFTDREWGEGTEPAAAFNPGSLDARQWAKVCRDAGMKMLIVTAKHDDGFCLWPTAYSDPVLSGKRSEQSV